MRAAASESYTESSAETCTESYAESYTEDVLTTYYLLLATYLEEGEGGGRQLAMRHRRWAPQRLTSDRPRLQP